MLSKFRQFFICLLAHFRKHVIGIFNVIGIPILQAFPLWLACFLELGFDLGVSQVHWQKLLTHLIWQSPAGAWT